jgi:hypothetical protein
MHSHLEESICDAEGKTPKRALSFERVPENLRTRRKYSADSPTELYGCVGARISSDAP